MITTIVLLRMDLRVSDNPALFEASKRGAVLPVFLYTRDLFPRPIGAAKKWWLHRALESFAGELKRRYNADLVFRTGESALDELEKLVFETKASGIFLNKNYDPLTKNVEERIIEHFKKRGLDVRSFKSFLLHEPEELRTDEGKPYTVFTPFWKKFQAECVVPKPLGIPESILKPDVIVSSRKLEELKLLPKIKWYDEMEKFWNVSETQAFERLKYFLDNALDTYKCLRDRPDLDNTSMLSPYLATGMISPRQIWHAVTERYSGMLSEGAYSFLRELGWREFSYHILYHKPELVNTNLRREFDEFPWSWETDELFLKWTQGLTGIPIIDAGMRQLWKIGWMHNRVRMIVASWLTKNMLKHWKLGEEWFWNTLVDADIANNVQGWQWTAGCGADAAPYFRIFNPVLQGKRFDPSGEYVKKWVPELRSLPSEYVHAPWEAPKIVLRSVGFELGKDYPLPMLPIEESRNKALSIFKQLSKRGRLQT
uniref:Deoxyribodipyrimidine photo-lyase n=1 Tax=Fervidobacterium thailandense TaxID=1008305 RepID=A0A7C5VK33_9BACT